MADRVGGSSVCVQAAVGVEGVLVEVVEVEVEEDEGDGEEKCGVEWLPWTGEARWLLVTD